MTRIGFAYNQKPEQSIVGGRIAGAARHESRSGDDPPSPISAHDDVYAEWDSAETIDAVATALSPFGEVIRIEANEDLPIRLRAERPDIVFNIAEGLHGPNREAHVPAICEFYGIPYSGSDPFTLSLCLHKARTKDVLRAHGVPTAPFALIESESDLVALLANDSPLAPRPTTRAPIFLKPVQEGSSKGITERNLVRSRAELEATARFLLATYDQPVIAEVFLPGAEFTCGVLGNGRTARVLPLVEMNFRSLPAGALPIYGYEAKWVWDRPDRPLDMFECPARVDVRLQHADRGRRPPRVSPARLPRLVARRRAARRAGSPEHRRGESAPRHPSEPRRQLVPAEGGARSGDELRRAHSERARGGGGADWRPPRRAGARPDAGADHNHGRMKVALLLDGASAYAANPDRLIIGTAEDIERSLVAEGNTVTWIPVYQDGKWIDKVRRGKFDLAFNMCEGIDGIATLESSVISVLELFKVPFTGASSYTTAICLRKPVINAILEKAGLPIPRFATIQRGDPLVSVGFPAIVKPAAEDASLGVEQRSVVRNTRQLAERVEAMLELWSEVIVQRYVDGREVNVGILGDTVLPISEIDFRKTPAGRWRIVTYKSKWVTGSEDDLAAIPRCPAKLPAKVANEIRRVAGAAWKIVGGFGYGRVDMRIDQDGRPWILEVNANPDIMHNAGFATMAQVAGVEYPALIRSICELGLERSRAKVAQENWALVNQLSGLEAEPTELDLFGDVGSAFSTNPATEPT